MSCEHCGDFYFLLWILWGFPQSPQKMNRVKKKKIIEIEVDFLETEFFFLAILFSVVAQAGDLAISYFKRAEKIKDVGKILPGHGGILDRIDSHLIATPILILLL